MTSIRVWTFLLPSQCFNTCCRCFPIVPKIAAHVLGLPITNHTQPVTLLGGLTFFGGAGNNYSMHVGVIIPWILTHKLRSS